MDTSGIEIGKHWDATAGRMIIVLRNGSSFVAGATVEDRYPGSISGMLCFAKSGGVAPQASASGGTISWRLTGLRPGDVRELVYTSLSPQALRDPAMEKRPTEKDYMLLAGMSGVKPRLVFDDVVTDPVARIPPPCVSSSPTATSLERQEKALLKSHAPEADTTSERSPEIARPEQTHAAERPPEAASAQEPLPIDIAGEFPRPLPSGISDNNECHQASGKMGTVIAVGAGKGGTGKTTFSINFGIALAEMGFSTVLMDADMSMSNMASYMGIDVQGMQATLHEVLAGEASPDKAVYHAFSERLRIVPSGLSIAGFLKMDRNRLSSVISHFAGDADFIVIDTPAGYNKEVALSLYASDDLVLVLNPDEGSMIDGLKVQEMARILDVRIQGIVLNRYDMTGHQYSRSQIEQYFGTPVIAMLPEDGEMRRKDKIPAIIANPGSRTSREIYRAAEIVSGRKREQAAASRPFATRLVEALSGNILRKNATVPGK